MNDTPFTCAIAHFFVLCQSERFFTLSLSIYADIPIWPAFRDGMATEVVFPCASAMSALLRATTNTSCPPMTPSMFHSPHNLASHVIIR